MAPPLGRCGAAGQGGRGPVLLQNPGEPQPYLRAGGLQEHAGGGLETNIWRQKSSFCVFIVYMLMLRSKGYKRRERGGAQEQHHASLQPG